MSVVTIQTYQCCYQCFKLISTPYTHLSHRLVFPALVPVPAPFPHSGRHRSVPCLYLPCVLWQNRGKWLKMVRTLSPVALQNNKKLLSYRACRDKAGWCRQRERERKPPSETGSPPTLRFKVGLQFVITRYYLVNAETSAQIKAYTFLRQKQDEHTFSTVCHWFSIWEKEVYSTATHIYSTYIYVIWTTSRTHYYNSMPCFLYAVIRPHTNKLVGTHLPKQEELPLEKSNLCQHCWHCFQLCSAQG